MDKDKDVVKQKREQRANTMIADMGLLQRTVEILKKEIDLLKERRVSQSDIIPDVVKQRHMGEANRFVWAGLAAERPTEGFMVTVSTTFYFATDTGVLSAWTGQNWKTVTFT